jgi:hypothetical protein
MGENGFELRSLTGRSSLAVGISIASWTPLWSTTTPTDHIAGSIWLPRRRLSSIPRQLAPKMSVGETFSAALFTSTKRPPHDENGVSDPNRGFEVSDRLGSYQDSPEPRSTVPGSELGKSMRHLKLANGELRTVAGRGVCRIPGRTLTSPGRSPDGTRRRLATASRCWARPCYLPWLSLGPWPAVSPRRPRGYARSLVRYGPRIGTHARSGPGVRTPRGSSSRGRRGRSGSHRR